MEKPKKLLLPDHSFGNDGFYVIYLSKRGSALYGVCSKQDPSLVIFDRVQIPEIDGIVFEFFEPSKSFSGRYILLNDTNNFGIIQPEIMDMQRIEYPFNGKDGGTFFELWRKIGA